MRMPNYKPTKWKIAICQECKRPISKHMLYYCLKRNHNFIEKENIPFFVPEMIIKHVEHKGWVSMHDGEKREYVMSPSNLEGVILKSGIGPGGRMPNRWWMWCKVGSEFSLKQVFQEDKE